MNTTEEAAAAAAPAAGPPTAAATRWFCSARVQLGEGEKVLGGELSLCRVCYVSPRTQTRVELTVDCRSTEGRSGQEVGQAWQKTALFTSFAVAVL